MQTVRLLLARLQSAALITAGLLALWHIPPLSDWFRAFVKLEPMRLPYTTGFFLLLFCALTLMSRWVNRHRYVSVVAVGACLGHLAAVVSIFFANFFIPDGIARTASTLQRDGVIGILVTDFIVAAILGGWLLGAVALAVLKWMISRRSTTAAGS